MRWCRPAFTAASARLAEPRLLVALGRRLGLDGGGLPQAAPVARQPRPGRDQGRSRGLLLPGQARLVRHGREPVWVVRTVAGELVGVSAVCTHLHCVLDFDRKTASPAPATRAASISTATFSVARRRGRSRLSGRDPARARSISTSSGMTERNRTAGTRLVVRASQPDRDLLASHQLRAVPRRARYAQATARGAGRGGASRRRPTPAGRGCWD